MQAAGGGGCRRTLIARGVATVAGVIAFRCLPRELGGRLTSVIKDRMREGAEHMMAELPEGSPPKLIMSVLPKLQARNDQIIAMLREQNELLREHQHTSVSTIAARGWRAGAWPSRRVPGTNEVAMATYVVGTIPPGIRVLSRPQQ